MIFIKNTFKRFAVLMALLAALLLAGTLPAGAQTYDEVFVQLEQLQILAESYAEQSGTGESPIDLALSYLRVGSYNTTLWQLTAGVRDPEFVAYVDEHSVDVSELPYVKSLTMPNGQTVDFNHLMASLQLVRKGLPVAGSWGGDAAQIAQAYEGRAADADGYIALMQSNFNTGESSLFGSEDLRADMDSVIMGAKMNDSIRLAALLQEHYTADLTDYQRAYQFIALTFGTVNTQDQAAFREMVYDTLIEDTGMQLLLYLNGMWLRDTWSLDPEAEAPLRAISTLLADTLSAAVNGETVESTNGYRMTTKASQALADALNALGDPLAAQAALAAGNALDATPQPEGVLGGIQQSLREKLDPYVLRSVLLVIGGISLLGMLVCLVMMIRDLRREE